MCVMGANPVLLSLRTDSLARTRSSIKHLRVKSRCIIGKALGMRQTTSKGHPVPVPNSREAPDRRTVYAKHTSIGKQICQGVRRDTQTRTSSPFLLRTPAQNNHSEIRACPHANGIVRGCAPHGRLSLPRTSASLACHACRGHRLRRARCRPCSMNPRKPSPPAADIRPAGELYAPAAT